MSMKKTTPSSHDISGVFVFLLLGIFAVFSTVMVLLGARVYKGTVERLGEHNAERIAPSYVRSMIRADDEDGGITIGEEAGVTVVTLQNEYDEELYLTRVYCYEGSLRELFSSAEREFDPADGEIVCACDEITAQKAPGLLTINLRNGDTWTQVDIALHALR